MAGAVSTRGNCGGGGFNAPDDGPNEAADAYLAVRRADGDQLKKPLAGAGIVIVNAKKDRKDAITTKNSAYKPLPYRPQ